MRLKQIHKPMNQKGNAIFLALMLLSIVSFGSLYVFDIIQNYARANSVMGRRTRVELECENIARISIDYSRYEIQHNFQITSDQLTSYLNTWVPTHLSPGYQI